MIYFCDYNDNYRGYIVKMLLSIIFFIKIKEIVIFGYNLFLDLCGFNN